MSSRPFLEGILIVSWSQSVTNSNPQTEEKRAVGAVWASRSGGRCPFVMPTDGDFSGVLKAAQSVQR